MEVPDRPLPSPCTGVPCSPQSPSPVTGSRGKLLKPLRRQDIRGFHPTLPPQRRPHVGDGGPDLSFRLSTGRVPPSGSDRPTSTPPSPTTTDDNPGSPPRKSRVLQPRVRAGGGGTRCSVLIRLTDRGDLFCEPLSTISLSLAHYPPTPPDSIATVVSRGFLVLDSPPASHRGRTDPVRPP